MAFVEERTEFQLSGPVGVAVGFGLAAVMLAPLLLLSKLAGMQFLAVQLGFIGGVYLGFGVADGRVAHLLTEFLVAGIFLAWAAVSLWADSPVLLAAGYAAHAAWDLAHHSRTRTVTTDVRSWYPPFCVAFDVLVAVFIVALLPLGGTN